jgi:hypothetical protein
MVVTQVQKTSSVNKPSKTRYAVVSLGHLPNLMFYLLLPMLKILS